jgi:hypothetical protein
MVDRCRQPPSAACEPACERWQCDRPLTGATLRLRRRQFAWRLPAVSGALRTDEQLFEDGVVDVPSEEARRGERPLPAQVAEMDL